MGVNSRVPSQGVPALSFRLRPALREFSGKAPPVLSPPCLVLLLQQSCPKSCDSLFIHKVSLAFRVPNWQHCVSKGKIKYLMAFPPAAASVGALTSSSAPRMRHLPSLLWKLNRLGSHSTQPLPRSQPTVCRQVRQILWLGGGDLFILLGASGKGSWIFFSCKW